MTWGGFFAPAGTPRPVIGRLSAAIATSLESVEIRRRWEAAGAEATWSSPEDFTVFVKSERARWERIANATGIKAE
jgi:tripartite-type tricarboxylate transporter receptor subunit TctC